jgi:hydrogenase-4 membrane subunit HyfE
VSPLLTALLGVLLVPLFIATWRISLVGLAMQGLLMAWIALRMGPPPSSPSDWLTLADLIAVRGLLAPLALYSVLAAQNTPGRNDVIPPNLLSWTIALGVVLLAFNFAGALVSDDGQQRTLVAVATTGLLLGFLVLSTQSGPFSQIIGALRIENAIALFELGGRPHHQSLALQLAQLGVVVATLGLYRWHLQEASRSPAAASPSPTADGPTL